MVFADELLECLISLNSVIRNKNGTNIIIHLLSVEFGIGLVQ